MKKYQVFSSVIIFMLFCSMVFSKTNENILKSKDELKITKLMFEIGSVYNLFSFDDNPIGVNNFYSTQIRAKIGVAGDLDGLGSLFVAGISYMNYRQLIKQNDFNFYVTNLFLDFHGRLTKKFSFLIGAGIGFYKIEYRKPLKTPLLLSLYLQKVCLSRKTMIIFKND